jgi:tetratricopeptide (TPR) repeat protein
MDHPRFSPDFAVLFSSPIRDNNPQREETMRRGFKGLGASMLAGAALLLAGTFEVRAADDAKTCIKESGDTAIEACSSAIKSGRATGHALARQYLSRGVERRAKEDYDMALADFAEALKADKKYADAFFNRCSIYNFKKEYDLAIAECGQAIKLGPSADATMAGGGELLGKDRAISDYYTERGFAYFKKDDYLHAAVDLDNAIRLNPSNGRALKTRGLAREARGDPRAEADLASAKLLGE